MTDHAPTPEQSAILDFAASSTSNLMIRALAGCGKTSTLELLDAAIRKQPHLYLVFNKANANEATKRMASTTTVRTFNSLGHRIWAQYCAHNLKLNSSKPRDLFKEIADEASRDERNAIWQVYDQVIHGVGIARALGYIPSTHAMAHKGICSRAELHSYLDEDPDDLTADLIDVILNKSIALAFKGEIDFNDQIYMPALFGGNFPRFPIVLVDEYQDLNPVNHLMVSKLTTAARLFGVGDEAQGIYAFRGAASTGMQSAIERYKMETLSLSVSFRCPSAIVENVHWRVPDFKANRNGGSVAHPTTVDVDDISDNGVILCRNNAPLLSTAFALLSAGRSVSVAGTDIGPRLIKTMQNLGPAELTQNQTLNAIAEWLAKKEAKGSKSAHDLAECMKVFARHGSTLGTAIGYAEHIFKQEGSIRLMTGHKSKGLEFDDVYHLDNHIIRDKGQDRNIRYVIDTRSRDKLTYINSEQIRWN